MSFLQNRTILVTGASGMLGRAVSQALTADNRTTGAGTTSFREGMQRLRQRAEEA